ncbi:MAG: ATP synthase F1 subunit delta [Lachnospiraceae bacterium]|nr:ATP synthase F1 subunit delta [Lachnospiraceae bacterium]
MTERAIQYGRALYELQLKEDIIKDSAKTLSDSKDLLDALDNPSVRATEKHAIIDKIFDKEITSFLKVVTDNHMISQVMDIFEAYNDCAVDAKNWAKATLYYVTKPDDEQIASIKSKIVGDTGKDGVELKLVEQPSLVGGFVLQVGDFETDRSVKGHIKQLTQNLMRR